LVGYTVLTKPTRKNSATLAAQAVKSSHSFRCRLRSSWSVTAFSPDALGRRRSYMRRLVEEVNMGRAGGAEEILPAAKKSDGAIRRVGKAP
jgi:hypothetical protein